jgi:predicted dehydrogenase
MISAISNRQTFQLPNGLHYEWTLRALHAGKHVLLEKPSCDTAAETRALFELAESKNLVLLEAVHYRFHPAIQRFREFVKSGELGTLQTLEVKMTVPAGAIRKDDIRFNYALGGGALMDVGSYVISVSRFLSGVTEELDNGSAPKVEVLDAHCVQPAFHADKDTERVDISTSAAVALPGNVTASLYCSLAVPWTFGIIPSMPEIFARATFTEGKAELYNFIVPTFYHRLTVTPSKGTPRVEKIYKFADGRPGEEYWTTCVVILGRN